MSYVRRKLLAPNTAQLIRRQNDPVELLQSDAVNLMVLIAPAGYGKSCCIEQLVKNVDQAYGWFTLDKNDNNPKSFWSYLSQAFCPIVPDIQESVNRLFSQATEPNYLEFADWLLNAVEQTGRKWDRPTRFNLVIDNFHILSNAIALESFSRFLDYAPHWIRVIILSRSLPAIDLTARLSKGQVVTVNKTMLAFNLAETKNYCELLLNTQCSAPEIERIYNKTEGWPSLIHILCLTIRSGLTLDNALSSTEENLSDFLLQQIFNHLPLSHQPICKTLALPRKFNKTLARSLFGEEGIQAFQTLTQKGYLASAIPNEPDYFQFTPLFREWLCEDFYNQLRHHLPNESQQIRQIELTNRIIHHFIKEDSDEALELAINSQQWEKALDIVQRAYPNHLQLYLSGAIDRILNLFPQEAIANHPYLLMVKALHQFSLFEYSAAKKTLSQLTSAMSENALAIQNPPLLEETRELIDIGVVFLESHMLRLSGKIMSATEKTASLLASIQHTQSPLKCWCYLGLTVDNFMNDKMTAAIDFGFKALALSKQTEDAPCIIAALGWLIPSLLLAGKVNIAEELSNEHIPWLHERGFDCLPDMVFLQAQRVSLFREKFDLNKAWHIYRDLEERLNIKTDPRNIIHAKYSIRFELLMSANRIKEAKALLPQLEAEIRGNYHPEDFIGFFDLDAMKAIADLKQGNYATLLTWHQQSNVQQDKTPHTKNNLELLDCLAELILQQDCTDKLTAIKQKSLNNGASWRAVKADLLLVALLNAQGKTEQAQNVFEATLITGRDAGFVGVFAEDVKALEPLLKKALKQRELTEYVQQLLATRNPEEVKNVKLPTSQANPPTKTVLAEKLTPREMEVLTLVSSGLSNNLICEKLGVSLSTVKNHLGNIFGKLNVKRRTEAISVARALNLL